MIDDRTTLSDPVEELCLFASKETLARCAFLIPVVTIMEEAIGKKIKTEELAPLEKTVNSISEAIKAESEIWEKNVVDLKANLTGPSPICNYLKDVKEAKILCSTQTSSN
ncbi:hypothetical protein AMECASPLE_007925 [Ameca splendens]|uniref:FRIGIDA-like protein n=1 Tax=Ameca splendens TaxID=208324 RepID=A0ABV0ZW30_9TELE